LKIHGTLHPIAEVIDAVQKRPMWRGQSEALGEIAALLGISGWQTDPVRVSDAVGELRATAPQERDPQIIDLEMPFIRAALGFKHITEIEEIAPAIRAVRQQHEAALTSLRNAASGVLRARRDEAWAERATHECSFFLRQVVRGLVADHLAAAYERLSLCLEGRADELEQETDEAGNADTDE
jgi:HAMP domain-containing protein